MKLHLSFWLVFFFVAVSCNSTKTSTNTEVVKAPNFELTNLSGLKKTLADYKGKIVLLNFWATWCPPCLAELPALNNIAKKYKSKGFEVVAVSCDSPEELEKVKQIQQKNSLEFDVLLDPEVSVPSTYGVSGFPESFFIGRNGEFLDFYDPEVKKKTQRIVSEREWDSAEIIKSIEELL